MQLSYQKYKPPFLKETASGADRILQEPRFVPRKVRGVTSDTLKSQDFFSQNLPRHLDSVVRPH